MASLLSVALLSGGAEGAVANPPCSGQEDAMKKRSDDVARIFDTTIKSPDPTSVEACIGSISGFGRLNYPDLSGLGQAILKQLCQEIRSQIGSALGSMNYNFQLGQFGGVSAGAGQGGGSTGIGSVPVTVTPISVTGAGVMGAIK